MILNASAITSAVKWAAVLGVITLALITYRQSQADARNLRDALITESAAKISAQARSQELSNANIQLQSALEITSESVRISNEAITELKVQNAAAQKVAAEQKAVLNDIGRLQSVANKRTTLIEKMSNRATKERFDELELLFNE
jgi:hypothetical protein